MIITIIHCIMWLRQEEFIYITCGSGLRFDRKRLSLRFYPVVDIFNPCTQCEQVACPAQGRRAAGAPACELRSAS